MRLLHFTGEGVRFYAGITEYIILANDSINTDHYKAQGFTLASATDLNAIDHRGTIIPFPLELPIDTTLVPR